MVYPDNGMLTEAERKFNRCLCKMRFVEEHAFGRWRCLLKQSDTTIQYIIKQVAARCVLHNRCEMQEEEYEEDWRVNLDVGG